jgi:hypothetical protein
MPKARSHRRSRTEAPKLVLPQERKTLFPIFAKIFAGILAICTLVGGAVVFLPRVTVEPDGAIDRSEPSSLSFTIANTGIIPLWQVTPRLGLCEIDWGIPQRPPQRCNGHLLSQLSPSGWTARVMTMDERETIKWSDLFKNNPARPATLYRADISIDVAFQPWFIPIPTEKEFRFETELESNGSMVWRSVPLDK